MSTSRKSSAKRADSPQSEKDAFNLTPDDLIVMPLSTNNLREQDILEQLTMLFTVQEERCISELMGENANGSFSKPRFVKSDLLHTSSFIYQKIDFDVLAKCVPSFVRTHLNRNGRYLPETFILKVNYWRRRRQLGEDTGPKKSSKEASRNCTEQGPSQRIQSSRQPISKQSLTGDTRHPLLSG